MFASEQENQSRGNAMPINITDVFRRRRAHVVSMTEFKNVGY